MPLKSTSVDSMILRNAFDKDILGKNMHLVLGRFRKNVCCSAHGKEVLQKINSE